MFYLTLLSSLSSALLLFWICQSIGWPLTSLGLNGFHKNPRAQILVRLLLSFALGLWLVSVLSMLWGMTLGLSREKNLILWVCLVAGGAASFQSLIDAYKKLFRNFQTVFYEKVLVTLMILVFGWALIFALVPPLLTDVVRYHQGVPHLWWQQGVIQKLPNDWEQCLVMLWQNADIPLLGLDQSVGAKIFNFAAFPLTLLTVGVAVYLYCGRSAAWVSMFIIGVTPTFFGNAVLGGVDAGLGWFTAMTWLFWVRGGSPMKRVFWTGLMIGLAISTKWQGVTLLGGFALLAIWEFRKKAPFLLIVMVAASFLIYLPWGLRNIFWAHDPIYPFLSQFFDPAAAAVAGKLGKELSHYGLVGEPWWQYGLYPLHLVFADFRWWFGGRFEFESEIGLIYLLILPFCAALCIKERRMRPLMFFALISFCLGLMQGEVPRYLIPVWITFSIAGGLLWNDLGKKQRWIYLGVLIVFSGWNLARISNALNQTGFAPLAYYRLKMSPEAFYSQIQPESRAAQWAEERYPGSKVLLFGLEGSLFWNNPVLVNGPYDEKTLVLVARETSGGEEMANRLKKMGVRLIAVDLRRTEILEKRFGYLGCDSDTLKKIQLFLKEKTLRVYKDGKIQIDRIK